MPDDFHTNGYIEAVIRGAPIKWGRNKWGGLVYNSVPGKPAWGVSEQAKRAAFQDHVIESQEDKTTFNDIGLWERWVKACEMTVRGTEYQ